MEKIDLAALYLSRTYCHKTRTRPPSCLSPWQLSKYPLKGLVEILCYLVDKWNDMISWYSCTTILTPINLKWILNKARLVLNLCWHRYWKLDFYAFSALKLKLFMLVQIELTCKKCRKKNILRLKDRYWNIGKHL